MSAKGGGGGENDNSSTTKTNAKKVTQQQQQQRPPRVVDDTSKWTLLGENTTFDIHQLLVLRVRRFVPQISLECGFVGDEEELLCVYSHRGSTYGISIPLIIKVFNIVYKKHSHHPTLLSPFLLIVFSGGTITNIPNTIQTLK